MITLISEISIDQYGKSDYDAYILLVRTSRSIFKRQMSICSHLLHDRLLSSVVSRIESLLFSSADGAIDSPGFPGTDILVIDVKDNDFITSATLTRLCSQSRKRHLKPNSTPRSYSNPILIITSISVS